MKTRLGFVSNSSSSSFICEVSGAVESGWDLSLEDAGMVECVNNHVFSEKFLVESTDIKEVKRTTVIWCCQHPEEFNPEAPGRKTPIRDEDHRQYFLRRYQEEQKKAEQQITWIQNYNGTDAQQFGSDFTQKFGDYRDHRYETLPSFCPICSLQHIRDQDLLNHMLADSGFARENLVEALQHKFSCLSDLQVAISLSKSTNTAESL